LSQVERELPLEPRPLSDAEWQNYLCELAMQELVEQYGPILREEDAEE
jgi:hypothetical protein